MTVTKNQLDAIYDTYNRRAFVHPDPLEVLYRFHRVRDREVVALIASSLAYGRVVQILKSVSLVLDKMGDAPYLFVKNTPADKIENAFKDFKHRFTTGQQLSALLIGIKGALKRHGSLQACFLAGLWDEDATVFEAMSYFVEEIYAAAGQPLYHLLPHPCRGSACKRLHLFLRWMVREDKVDPGGWNHIPPSVLIVPVDAHMHRIGKHLGFTNRRSANLITALEITDQFRRFAPEDPVKYDFCLTRMGIRKDVGMGILEELCQRSDE